MRCLRGFMCAGLIVAIALPAAIGASDKRERVDSHWRDRTVIIDGDSGEWAGPLVPVDRKHPVTAAAVNDGQFLYLVLSTSEAAMRAQIMRQGLIVWFDPSGGDKKVFGVKFPVGMAGGDMGGRGRGFRREDPPDSGQGERPEAPPRAEPLNPPNRLEVLGPKKDDVHSFLADAVPGIAVKVGSVEGSLVYELKVPIALSADFQYAIGAKPGALIGFGLETPKVEKPSRESGGGMGGMGGGGGMGGRGGRGGGGGRGGMGRGGGGESGGMGRGGFEPPKPVKAWATIQLSAK